MTSTLRSAARGSGVTFIGSVVSAIAGFAFSVVLARMLGPEGSGIVFQMISIFTIAGAAAKFGLDTTAVWLLPRLASQDPSDVRRATVILLWGSLLGGIVTGLVLIVIAPLLSGDSEDLETLTRIAGLFMPLSTLGVVALAVTRGLGGVRDYVLIGFITLPVGRLAAVSVAAAFAATAMVAGSAWLGVLVLVAVLAFAAVRRALKPYSAPDERTTAHRPMLRRIVAFSAPRTLSSAIEQALVWLDVLIVGLIAGPGAAGVYGVVSRLVQAGTIPSTSVRIVVAPDFSRMLQDGRITELDKLYTRTAQWIVLFSMPIFTTLMVLGEPVLSIFGTAFRSGAVALTIMCVGAIVSACTGNVQSLLLMSGRSGWVALNKVIVLAVSLGLLLTLVPILGIVGAAIAFTVSISLDAILASLQVRIGVKVRQNYATVLYAAATAGLVSALPLIAARMFLGQTILALSVGIGGALLGWAATLFVMRRQFELDQVGALVRSRRR